MTDSTHDTLAAPWAAAPAAIAAALQVDPSAGLDLAEVAARRARHGENALQAAPPPSAWRRLLQQLRDPLIYLLLAAIGISLLTSALGPRDHWPVDAIVIAGIVGLNALLGHLHETRAAMRWRRWPG